MTGATDFVAAQAANRRNTFLLLLVLTGLAALFGYLIGWVLQEEATDEVPLVSTAGLAIAAGMTVASVGWRWSGSGMRFPCSTSRIPIRSFVMATQ